MIHNSTIDHQLNHRSIRAFKPQALSKEQLTTLYEAARHTSSSMFMQQFSILHITDEKKRAAVRQLGKQPYIGQNGELLIFLVDLGDLLFEFDDAARPQARTMAVCTLPTSSSRPSRIPSWPSRIPWSLPRVWGWAG